MTDGFAYDLIFLAVLAANVMAVIWFFLTLRLDPAPVARRISLRALARDSLLEGQRRERLIRIWRDLVEDNRLIALVPFVLLGSAVFLPLPISTGIFTDVEASDDFLKTMWQVVAGALGLSVAMIAFAFEAFFSSAQRQVGSSLREFAAETRLLWAVQLGVLALLVNGLVLLGVGYEAPAGWAAIYATALSAFTLLGVPYVLSRVVRALDIDELLRMRRDRLRKTVAEAMWQQLLGQAADTLLRKNPEFGVGRQWLKSRRGLSLKAPSDGVLRDVRLGSLSRLAARGRRVGRDSSVDLLVGLGTRVSLQLEVLVVDPNAPFRDRRTGLRALRIERSGKGSANHRLIDQLARLHGEAMNALREGRVEDWRPLGDLYQLVLLELARAAERYGLPFEGAIAAPGLMGFGPVQRITGYLRKELEEAVKSQSRDGADAVAYLPGMISREALDAGLVVVAKEMLGLYPAMYWIARRYRSGENGAGALLLDRATRYLTEFDFQVENPFRELASTVKEREQAMELGLTLFAEINAILKAALDDSDGGTFRELERKWTGMFEDEVGDVIDSTRDEEKTPQDLGNYRLVLELGLAMWAAHLYAQAPSPSEVDDDVRVEALRILAGRFDGPEALFEVHEQANDREDREHGVPWTNWFLHEFGEGVHAIPTTSELLFVTILILVGRYDLNLDGLELKPRLWHEHSEQEIEDALRRLRDESERWSAVFGFDREGKGGAEKTEDWGSRVDQAEELLKAARQAAAEYRRAKTRAADLDPALAAEFRDALLKEAKEARLIRDLFAVQGALRKSDGDLDKPVFSPAWLPKRLFIADSNLAGLTGTARSLARETRGRESMQLLEALEGLEPQSLDGDLASRLREEVRRMAESGTAATLLLIPSSWRLRQSLGLEMWGASTVVSELVPLNRTSDFAGVFEGVPALDVPHAPKDRLWLVNLPATATFVEWKSERDTGIEVELKQFNSEGAAEFLAEHPEVRGEDESEEEALRTLQEKVLCRQFYRWRIEPTEKTVGTCLTVPDDLRR